MPYCKLEKRDFPDDEFREDDDHGLVHCRGRPHTILGDYLDEGEVGTADANDVEFGSDTDV